MEIETLDVLPGEGEVKTTTKQRQRIGCEECGEAAHFRHTFVLHNARNNPQSGAYGRDEIIYCADAERFVCREHQNPRGEPEGMHWCATFAATAQTAHMFLRWRDIT